MGGVADPVVIHRRWNDDAGLLDNVREFYTLGADNRANGYLLDAGQDWVWSFAPRGKALVTRLERMTGATLGIVVYQAYLDGSGCDWHADLGYDVQAILSLGVTRTFGIRRTGEVEAYKWYRLDHGDLLIMPHGFQDQWEHTVPVEDAPGERVSLVFRSTRP